jgi:hypothetical protein
MSPLPEHPDPLLKLLVCKKYEQPPPGYFAAFPEKVLAGIQAEGMHAPSSWWTPFKARLDVRPVLVGAYGVAVSGLLFFGFSLSEAFEAEMSAAMNFVPEGVVWETANSSTPLVASVDQAQSSPIEHTPAAFLSIVRPSALTTFPAVRIQLLSFD